MGMYPESHKSLEIDENGDWSVLWTRVDTRSRGYVVKPSPRKVEFID